MATSFEFCRYFVLVSLVLAGGCNAQEKNKPRAFFVFGDSLVDNGNNNYLATPARADSPPYGIDYPLHRPTGRFSNGLTIPDLISEHIGGESPMPYLNPLLKGKHLLAGANFASAGVGILNDTGKHNQNVQATGSIRLLPKTTECSNWCY
ncbi:hypothetical protein ACFE04_025173 [Oxalis oulophora]